LPFSVPVGLLFGMSLAWLARIELARSEVPLVLARPFVVAAAFGAIVYAPIVAYFVVMHGDWAYLYLTAFGQIPSAVDLTLIVIAAAQIPLGLAIATPWAIARRGPALLKACTVLGVLLLVACAIAARRLSVSASYAQYHASFGVTPIGKTPLGRGVLLSWVALLAGYAFCLHVLRTPRTEP
jgi:hypothetical protein